ncbi:hypothetical protein, partial [Kingella denitrificans]
RRKAVRMMTEQLRFERWAAANGYAVHRRGGCQEYAHQITRLLWQAWQAACTVQRLEKDNG